MNSGKKSFRDRRDAYYCTDVTGMNQILIDLKPRRSLGELYINQKMDVTELVKYMKELKEDNKDIKLTYFHAFLALMAKTINNRPLLNRFVANRHVYVHKDLTISFVMKVAFEDTSKEIMVILPIKDDDNIISISKKIGEKVEKVRNNKDTGKGANDAIEIVGKLPNIIRVPIMGIFKYLDRIGKLPASLVEDNIYYSSMIVSNIGSLKCGGIYHNVTDFGTCSGLMTIGEIKEEDDGKYYCEFGITIDERIADGFYFIKSLKLMQYILDNPALLESRVDEVIEIEE